MNEQKLILDQPDMITNQGKVEHVVTQPKLQPINDAANPNASTPENVLLNEDPMEGLTIIRG